MRFKLLSGSHIGPSVKDPEGNLTSKTYETGDIIESDIDLAARFLNKFEKLPDAPSEIVPEQMPKGNETPPSRRSPKAPTSHVTLPPTTTRAKDTKEKTEEEESLGEDVSDKFPETKDMGLKVFKEGRHYFVAKADAPTEPLNGEDNELTTKEHVQEFLEDYEEEEEEEDEE
jgi:hypothetical protein